MKFSAKSLLYKKVMSTDGKELGILNNIYINSNKENMIYISISKKEQQKYKKNYESILIPFESINAIKDYIIIDKQKLKIEK